VFHISDSEDEITNIYNPPERPKNHTNPESEADRQWRVDDKVTNTFIFHLKNELTSINPDLFDCMIDGSPLYFYKLLVDDEMIEKIVIETNRYAYQQIM
jgi:hypothetical protein